MTIRDEFLARVHPEHRDAVARVLDEQGFDIDALAARIAPLMAEVRALVAEAAR